MTKFYPGDCARAVLNDFFDDPLKQIDPHQQITGMSADQMIHFTRAVSLELSMATFELLEDVLLEGSAKID